MSKMIQIRHVPDEVHRTLAARAAEAGMSLSDYLLAEVTKVAERPTMAEVVARLRSLSPIEFDTDPAEHVRRLRDAS